MNTVTLHESRGSLGRTETLAPSDRAFTRQPVIKNHAAIFTLVNRGLARNAIAARFHALIAITGGGEIDAFFFRKTTHLNRPFTTMGFSVGSS